MRDDSTHMIMLACWQAFVLSGKASTGDLVVVSSASWCAGFRVIHRDNAGTVLVDTFQVRLL